MNKAELVSAIAKRADVPASTVDSVIAGLQEELVEAITRGDKVAVPGLLTVERSQRSARTGRNPQTGESIEIAAAQHRQGHRRLDPEEGRGRRPGELSSSAPAPPDAPVALLAPRARMRGGGVADRGAATDERRHMTAVQTDLSITTDPAEVGMDAGRLERLDRRLARWVDEGQLPGFLVTVARHGELVHVGGTGTATSRPACRSPTTPAGGSTR